VETYLRKSQKSVIVNLEWQFPGASSLFTLSTQIFVARVQFCNWFYEAVCIGEANQLLTYFTDKTSYIVMYILKLTDTVSMELGKQ
jgi:hypothetical protein